VSILLSVFNVTVDRSRCTYILAIKHRLGDVDDGDDDNGVYENWANPGPLWLRRLAPCDVMDECVTSRRHPSASHLRSCVGLVPAAAADI